MTTSTRTGTCRELKLETNFALDLVTRFCGYSLSVRPRRAVSLSLQNRHVVINSSVARFMRALVPVVHSFIGPRSVVLLKYLGAREMSRWGSTLFVCLFVV